MDNDNDFEHSIQDRPPPQSFNYPSVPREPDHQLRLDIVLSSGGNSINTPSPFPSSESRTDTSSSDRRCLGVTDRKVENNLCVPRAVQKPQRSLKSLTSGGSLCPYHRLRIGTQCNVEEISSNDSPDGAAVFNITHDNILSDNTRYYYRPRCRSVCDGGRGNKVTQVIDPVGREGGVKPTNCPLVESSLLSEGSCGQSGAPSVRWDSSQVGGARCHQRDTELLPFYKNHINGSKTSSDDINCLETDTYLAE